MQEPRARRVVAPAALARVVRPVRVGGSIGAPILGLAEGDDAPGIDEVADAVSRGGVADEAPGVGGEGAVEPGPAGVCGGGRGVVGGTPEDGPFVGGHGGGDEVGFEGEVELRGLARDGEGFGAGEGAAGGEGGEGGDVVHDGGEAGVEHGAESGVEGAEGGGEVAHLHDLCGGVVVGGLEDGLGDAGGLLEGCYEDGADGAGGGGDEGADGGEGEEGEAGGEGGEDGVEVRFGLFFGVEGGYDLGDGEGGLGGCPFHCCVWCGIIPCQFSRF